MLRVILILCPTAGTFSQFNYTRLLELTNKYRSNIGSLSGVVWPYINTYNATSKVSNLGTAYPNLTGSGYTAAIAWNEGMTAFLNLTTYIVQETPNNAARVNLTLNSKMAASSLAHSTDIGSKGLTGHIGSDGSNFFFRQKTAYEISACLVGSEMCIRDRYYTEISNLRISCLIKNTAIQSQEQDSRSWTLAYQGL
eukprot:TRINITY_DN10688_c0_g1_i8.p1 TRINITY_DN10688_c0_g1~~TRINITY_DN10688_c0_g1_i8.p1  ORF type:complete len:196 (-),score=28.19 TRINITY_DN10688_c0_g1_i8:167-754(-)